MSENVIVENSIQTAWTKTFSKVLNSPKHELSPFMVRVCLEDDSFDALGNAKEILNNELIKRKEFAIETVASTIFPRTLWNPMLPRTKLYDTYLRNWPKYKRCPQNRFGTYFQRLIAFNIVNNNEVPVNQLENIISFWEKGNRRRSAFQANILDPRVDQRNTPYQTFPCMQQVAFIPHGSNGSEGLEVVAFYAIQTVFEKAYGNYLGLCRLGRFMASQMNLSFCKITCVASVLKLQLGSIPISYMRELDDQFNKIG